MAYELSTLVFYIVLWIEIDSASSPYFPLSNYRQTFPSAYAVCTIVLRTQLFCKPSEYRYYFFPAKFNPNSGKRRKLNEYNSEPAVEIVAKHENPETRIESRSDVDGHPRAFVVHVSVACERSEMFSVLSGLSNYCYAPRPGRRALSSNFRRLV